MVCGRQSTGDTGKSEFLVRLLRWQASFNRHLGRLALASQLIERSQELLEDSNLVGQDTNQDVYQQKALNMLEFGIQAANQIDAVKWYEQALAIQQSLNDRWASAQSLYLLGDRLSVV